MKYSLNKRAMLNARVSFSMVLMLFLSMQTLGQTSLKELPTMVSDETEYKKLMKSGMVQHQVNAFKAPSAYRKFIKKGYRAEKIGILTLNLQRGTKEASLGEGSAQQVIDAIAPKVIASFKEEGAKQDVTILTPDEYLTTQEAKELDNSIEATIDLMVAAQGFKPITNCGAHNRTISRGFYKDTL